MRRSARRSIGINRKGRRRSKSPKRSTSPIPMRSRKLSGRRNTFRTKNGWNSGMGKFTGRAYTGTFTGRANITVLDRNGDEITGSGIHSGLIHGIPSSGIRDKEDYTDKNCTHNCMDPYYIFVEAPPMINENKEEIKDRVRVLRPGENFDDYGGKNITLRIVPLYKENKEDGKIRELGLGRDTCFDKTNSCCLFPFANGGITTGATKLMPMNKKKPPFLTISKTAFNKIIG